MKDMDQNQPIGVFDSGLGGISVLRHILDRGVWYAWKGSDGRSYKIICDK